MAHAHRTPSASSHCFSKPVTAALVLADGSVYRGQGIGAACARAGEVVFNTSMTGYQEILTDPSYAGQIVTFTFPHIGNVGTNPEDIEGIVPAVRGCILRTSITEPSNWRAVKHFDEWLKDHDIPGIAGIDTRALTRRIRSEGAPNGVIVHAPDGNLDLESAHAQALSWPGLVGMDLTREVSCAQSHEWDQTRWRLDGGYGIQTEPRFHVVAVDFGAKRNILRCLAAAGCRVTVVPATTTAEAILQLNPDGVFLSNGPGDPAASGEYAIPMVNGIIAADVPLFGICLGHQIIALALGAKTRKMGFGHRGVNHPVKNMDTGRVEITSQNHGFVVEDDTVPTGVSVTHRSLFDQTIEGVAVDGKQVFAVQYHPEASSGPEDSHYLFTRFIEMMERNRAR